MRAAMLILFFGFTVIDTFASVGPGSRPVEARDGDAKTVTLDAALAAGALSPFEKALASGDATITIRIMCDGTFRHGTAELDDGGRAALKVLARRIVATIGKTADIDEVEVTGHTDSRAQSENAPYGSNHELSAARALAVSRELIAGGVPDRLLKITGVGARRPLAADFAADGSANSANMRMNRRVEIAIFQATR